MSMSLFIEVDAGIAFYVCGVTDVVHVAVAFSRVCTAAFNYLLHRIFTLPNIYAAPLLHSPQHPLLHRFFTSSLSLLY
jgi:hypothetical protein